MQLFFRCSNQWPPPIFNASEGAIHIQGGCHFPNYVDRIHIRGNSEGDSCYLFGRILRTHGCDVEVELTRKHQ